MVERARFSLGWEVGLDGGGGGGLLNGSRGDASRPFSWESKAVLVVVVPPGGLVQRLSLFTAMMNSILPSNEIYQSHWPAIFVEGEGGQNRGTRLNGNVT